MLDCVFNLIGKEQAGRQHIKTTADMFLEKYEKRAAMKEKELEIRKMELELQKQKWKFEEQERKQRLELDVEERRAFIELVKKYASNNCDHGSYNNMLVLKFILVYIIIHS